MGTPILSYSLPHPVDAGIRQSVLPGYVTEYECRDAARFNNYTWTEWLEQLDNGERAMCVAYMRVSHAIEANVHDAHNQYSERMSRRAAKRRR